MKTKRFVFLLAFVLLLSACNSIPDPKQQATEVYQTALVSIMEMDTALNHEMAFIAIDMRNFVELDETEKESVITFLKNKYAVEVMDATFEQLEEQKRFNRDSLTLDGVLLRIEAIDMDARDVVFEGSKYKSGLGAFGAKGVVTYKENQWQIKESKMTWIS